MQIGNPIPTLSTVQIGGTTAPSTLASITTQVMSSPSSSQIGGLTGQLQIVIQNQGTAGTVYVSESGNTTSAQGAMLSPGGSLTLDGSYAVKLHNTSGSSATIGGVIVKT